MDHNGRTSCRGSGQAPMARLGGRELTGSLVTPTQTTSAARDTQARCYATRFCIVKQRLNTHAGAAMYHPTPQSRPSSSPATDQLGPAPTRNTQGTNVCRPQRALAAAALSPASNTQHSRPLRRGCVARSLFPATRRMPSQVRASASQHHCSLACGQLTQTAQLAQTVGPGARQEGTKCLAGLMWTARVVAPCPWPRIPS